MMRFLWTLPFALVAGSMAAGCADDPNSGRQRPAYSYENVDMGSPQPGRSDRDDVEPDDEGQVCVWSIVVAERPDCVD